MISLTSPQQWSVERKKKNGSAIIRVVGSTTTAQSGNAVRFGPIGGVLVDADAFGVTGSFSGSFVGTPALPGVVVEVYEIANPANVIDTFSVSEVWVGKKVLIIAQSNGLSHAESVHTSTHGGIQDSSGNWSQVGIENEFGPMVQHYYDSYGEALGVHLVAHGQTSFLDWCVGSDYFAEFKRAISLMGGIAEFDAIIVRIAETDAGTPIGGDLVASTVRLASLINGIAKTTAKPFIFTKCQNNANILDANEQHVFAAFDIVIAKQANAYIGADLTDIGDDPANIHHLVGDADVILAGQRQAAALNAIVG